MKKFNLVSTVIALLIGLTVGAVVLGNHPELADGSRVEHYTTIGMLVLVSIILIFKQRENKVLKAQLEEKRL